MCNPLLKPKGKKRVFAHNENYTAKRWVYLAHIGIWAKICVTLLQFVFSFKTLRPNANKLFSEIECEYLVQLLYWLVCFAYVSVYLRGYIPNCEIVIFIPVGIFVDLLHYYFFICEHLCLAVTLLFSILGDIIFPICYIIIFIFVAIFANRLHHYFDSTVGYLPFCHIVIFMAGYFYASVEIFANLLHCYFYCPVRILHCYFYICWFICLCVSFANLCW